MASFYNPTQTTTQRAPQMDMSGINSSISNLSNITNNIIERRAREEELDRQHTRQKIQDDRQKVLDDRNTNTYNQQQQELTDRQKFEQAMLGDTQMRYADVTSSKDVMSLMKNIEFTPEELELQKQGKSTPAIEAKLKAQIEFGENFDNFGVRETEWEKAQRIAKETGTARSLGVQERLYGVKAADVKAREDKIAADKAAKNELLKRYDDQSDKLDELLVVKRGRYGGDGAGSNGSYTSNKSTSNKDFWTPDALKEVHGIANTLTPFGYESTSDGKPATDTKLAVDVVNYAKPELSPAETKHVLAMMGGTGDESYFSGEVLTKYGKEVPREELARYGKDLVDSLVAKKNSSAGGTGATGGTGVGFYNKEDNSAAIKMKKVKLESLKRQIDAANRMNYDAPEGSPEEHSIERMNAYAKKHWSEIPATGETPKKSGGSSTGSSTGTVKKSSLIPGKIGTAMSSGTDGDVARLTLLPEFVDAYEGLTKPQQARVDKVLGSAASMEYFKSIKEGSNNGAITSSSSEGADKTKDTKVLPSFDDLSKATVERKSTDGFFDLGNTVSTWFGDGSKTYSSKDELKYRNDVKQMKKQLSAAAERELPLLDKEIENVKAKSESLQVMKPKETIDSLKSYMQSPEYRQLPIEGKREVGKKLADLNNVLPEIDNTKTELAQLNQKRIAMTNAIGANVEGTGLASSLSKSESEDTERYGALQENGARKKSAGQVAGQIATAFAKNAPIPAFKGAQALRVGSNAKKVNKFMPEMDKAINIYNKQSRKVSDLDVAASRVGESIEKLQRLKKLSKSNANELNLLRKEEARLRKEYDIAEKALQASKTKVRKYSKEYDRLIDKLPSTDKPFTNTAPGMN